MPTVSQDIRLDNRWLDIRTPTNQAIFRFQSVVCKEFRDFLLNEEFVEIHSPKIISAASEGGSEVFELKYFNRNAYLAQSPQLYKQMAIMSGLEKVFEIGPVFRAENSNSNRHLTEFVGLDIEMEFKDHYHEVLNVICKLFEYMFEQLGSDKYKVLRDTVWEQFPAEPIKFLKPSLRLTFKEAVELLKENGVNHDAFTDMNTVTEIKLGEIVKKKYNTDFFILDKFPTAIRPFYTMVDPKDNNYSNSYDAFLRGQEIMSGAQRIHGVDELIKNATECKKGKIDLAPIMSYINSFKNGAPPHAGCGIGLERIVMLYLGLTNIRRTTLFPRDPKRVTP
jgi:nondiscriminating aspartyl-tRNA synthetase